MNGKDEWHTWKGSLSWFQSWKFDQSEEKMAGCHDFPTTLEVALVCTQLPSMDTTYSTWHPKREHPQHPVSPVSELDAHV